MRKPSASDCLRPEIGARSKCADLSNGYRQNSGLRFLQSRTRDERPLNHAVEIFQARHPLPRREAQLFSPGDIHKHRTQRRLAHLRQDWHKGNRRAPWFGNLLHHHNAPPPPGRLLRPFSADGGGDSVGDDSLNLGTQPGPPEAIRSRIT